MTYLLIVLVVIFNFGEGFIFFSALHLNLLKMDTHFSEWKTLKCICYNLFFVVIKIFIYLFIFTLFYFTILYWFCHTLT